MTKISGMKAVEIVRKKHSKGYADLSSLSESSDANLRRQVRIDATATLDSLIDHVNERGRPPTHEELVAWVKSMGGK